MAAFPPDFQDDDFPSDPFDGEDAFVPPTGAQSGVGKSGRARAHPGAGIADVETDAPPPATAHPCAGRPRRARARPSLKMQAIGYLSRREYSRQELRRKLLAWLRERERDEAALAAAAQAAAREEAQALRDWPSNGIDDAFVPPPPPPRPPSPSPSSPARVEAAPPAPRTKAREEASPSPGAVALSGLRLASGAPLPVALRRTLAGLAPEEPAAGGGAARGAPEPEPDAARLARLEREDPEAAVDQLLDWLAAQRYLSDTRFVESRINARARKQGTAMIRHELARHGLALEPQQAATLRETEFARARTLWERKFGAPATEPRERARQARFLAGRGFAAEIVRRIVGGEDER